MADDDDRPEDDRERDVVAEADAMADELEDELADEVTNPSPPLPRTLLVPAAILVGAIAAPLTPDGYSFAQIRAPRTLLRAPNLESM